MLQIFMTRFLNHIFLNKNKFHISSESGSLPPTPTQRKILYMYAPVLMRIKLLMLGLTTQEILTI